MTQFARPNSDISVQSWSVQPGGSYYTTINEVVANDSNYIQSGGSNNTYKCGLTAVTDPQVSTGHAIVLRASDSHGNTPQTLSVALMQGATTIVPTTVIAPVLTAAWTNYTLTLTSAQADAITDYSALQLWITSTTVQFLQTLSVSQAYFQVPDAVVSAFLASAIAAGGSVGASAAFDARISSGVSGAGAVSAAMRPDALLGSVLSGAGSMDSSLSKGMNLVVPMTGSGNLAGDPTQEILLAAGIAGGSFLAETLESDLLMESVPISGGGGIGPTLTADMFLAAVIGAAGSDNYQLARDVLIGVDAAGNGQLAAAGEYVASVAADIASSGDLAGSLESGALLGLFTYGASSLSAAVLAEALLNASIDGVGDLAQQIVGGAFEDIAAHIVGTGALSSLADYEALMHWSAVGSGVVSPAARFDANLRMTAAGAASLTLAVRLGLNLGSALAGVSQITGMLEAEKLLRAAAAATSGFGAVITPEALLRVGIAGASALTDADEFDVLLALALIGESAMTADSPQGILVVSFGGAGGLTAVAEYLLDEAAQIAGSGGVIPTMGERPIAGIKTGRIRTPEAPGWIAEPSSGRIDRPASGLAII